MRSTLAKFVTLFLGANLLIGFSAIPLKAAGAGASTVQQGDQASAALHEGRRLLKLGKADQALGQLQTALNLYTAAKNNGGMAAAHNELGDLYLRQGQYNVALDHYKKAFEGFVGANKKQEAFTAAAAGLAYSRLTANIADDKFNANLMLAKIGDVNFRLGRLAEASAAYSQMQVKKPESAASKATRRFGGLGGIAYFNNDLDSAKKHFENALEASGSSIAGIAKLGQTRRFRAAARTSLGDVALRQDRL